LNVNGQITLQLIIIGLAITLRKYLAQPAKIPPRNWRAGFTHVVAPRHLGSAGYEPAVGQMWADIWKRPYITIGMAAALDDDPLAVKHPNNPSCEIGGAMWRKMHNLYPLPPRRAVHFIMVLEVEPMLYLWSSALLATCC
jgi:sulfoxide reductase heme-binding subunit YedZ